MNLQYTLIGIVLLLAGCATTETAKPKKDPFDGMDFETILAKANEGKIRAKVKVARMYDAGDGVEKSPERSVNWTRKAALKGDPEAETMLEPMPAISEDTGKARWKPVNGSPRPQTKAIQRQWNC